MMSAARMNLSSYFNTAKISDLEQNQSLQNIIQLVDESCKEVRAVSHSMMPAALLSKGLPDAVAELTSKVSSDALKLNFYSEGFTERFDSNTETNYIYVENLPDANFESPISVFTNEAQYVQFSNFST